MSKGWENFKTGVVKVASDVGKGLAKVASVLGDAVCATIGAPICAIVKIVQTVGGFIGRVTKLGFEGALKSYWEEFKQRIEAEAKYAKEQFERLFNGFKSILTIRESNEILPKVGNFAKTAFETVTNLTKRFLDLIGVPGFLSQLLGWINGGTIAGTLTAAVTPLALINFGVRKLMEWALPKLILGAGEAVDVIQRKYPAVGMVINVVMDVIKKVAPAAGGIIGVFAKSPEAKARISAVLSKIADVSGKISQGIKATLSIAEKARSGNFAELDDAVSQTQLPKTLSKEELGKVIGGLVDFAKDQIWSKLDPALRQLLGKALMLLDRLLDIPRNALVAGVGTIPFAGGVLASGLNFGLGILVDMIKGLLTDQIMALAEEILKDVVDSMKAALNKELLKDNANVNKANKFIELVKMMGDFAGEVSAITTSIEAGARDGRAAIAAVVTQALDSYLLRGIANVELRRLLSSAIGTVAADIGKPGVTLTSLVGRIVRSSVQPISRLVAGLIKDAEIRAIVQPALATVLTQLAEPGALRTAMSNPIGFIGDAAKRAIAAARQPLIALVTKRLGNNPNAAVQAVGTLVTRVNDEGFAVLLRIDTWTALVAQVAAGPVAAAPAEAAAPAASEAEAPAAASEAEAEGDAPPEAEGEAEAAEPAAAEGG